MDHQQPLKLHTVPSLPCMYEMFSVQEIDDGNKIIHKLGTATVRRATLPLHIVKIVDACLARLLILGHESCSEWHCESKCWQPLLPHSVAIQWRQLMAILRCHKQRALLNIQIVWIICPYDTRSRSSPPSDWL